MTNRPGIVQKRPSLNRFRQIPRTSTDESMWTSGNPNDVTIDIPLTPVRTNVSSQSATGTRKVNSTLSSAPHMNPEEFHDRRGERVSGQGPGLRTRQRTVDDLSTEAEDGTLTRMGHIYRAILNFSVLTRYLIYVSPIALLIAIPIVIGATVARGAHIGGVPMYWFFTWVEVSWLSLWVSKIFAHFFPYVFQWLAGMVSPGTRKYALMLRALQIPISMVGLCIVSLVTFLPIMTLNPEMKRQNDTGVKQWESVIKNILFALLLCSLIFLAEKTVIQLISIDYHRTQFDSKIRESKHNIYLLEQLYEASRRLFPDFCPEFRAEDEFISDPLIGSVTRPVFSRKTTAAPMQLIRNVGQGVGRLGDKVTAALGNVAQEITGKHVSDPTATHTIVIQTLERKKASEAMARRIWMSFVIEGKDALYFEDILEVLGEQRREQAEECFAMLDRDSNGDVSLEEMILTIAEMGRTRKSLAHSLHDVDQAISALDSLLLAAACIISILVFVSFVTNGFGTIVAAAATALVSLSVIFSLSAQEVVASSVFLFVKHPFDVGDRVEVQGTAYIVERISLLYSVFRNVSDNRITQTPNNILNTLNIDNITRSKAMREQLTLPVSFHTTFAEIEKLKVEMEVFARDKENSRDFFPEVNIEVVAIGAAMDQLVLCIDIRHKSNWSNETIRASRRSKFMCALVLALRKIPILSPGAAAPDPSSDYKDQSKSGESTLNGQPEIEVLQDKATAEWNDTKAVSTGFDSGHSNASLHHRGAPNKSEQDEAAFAEELNARSPAEDEARDASGTTGLLSSEANQLSVDYDRNLSRQPSTGRRKASTTRSISPRPQAAGGVPIIAQTLSPYRPRSQHSSPGSGQHDVYSYRSSRSRGGESDASAQSYWLPSSSEGEQTHAPAFSSGGTETSRGDPSGLPSSLRADDGQQRNLPSHYRPSSANE